MTIDEKIIRVCNEAIEKSKGVKDLTDIIHNLYDTQNKLIYDIEQIFHITINNIIYGNDKLK